MRNAIAEATPVTAEALPTDFANKLEQMKRLDLALTIAAIVIFVAVMILIAWGVRKARKKKGKMHIWVWVVCIFVGITLAGQLPLNGLPGSLIALAAVVLSMVLAERINDKINRSRGESNADTQDKET